MRRTRIKDLDFKPRAATLRRRRIKPIHWLALSVSAIVGVTLLLSGQQPAEALLEASSSRQETPLALPEPSQIVPPAELAQQPIAAPLPPPRPEATPEAESEPPPVAAALPAEEAWQSVTVRSGDTLGKIFNRIGLNAGTMYQVLGAGEAAKSLVRIYPGDEIKFLIDGGDLKGMRYRIDESVTLHVDQAEDGFATALVATPLERRLAHAVGSIDSSLFLAGKAAGLSDALIMQMANIFGWDIDFALDIRSGDRFSVVFEELYRNGERIRNGAIVAAEFVNQGRSFRAVAYTNDKGERDYYTPDGRSMRKAFLRSPVDFRRISSGFNPNRLHPVLGTKRPHRGVDYAAATGTPIRAAGDGRIVHRGTKGGYGRTIIIQHGQKYSTLYAHMSRYASGLSNGSRVRQGQVIGYVGSSGLATGPHLHYEFLVNGVHRNPLTVALPEAEPISKSLMADFNEQTTPLVAQLDVISRSQFALTEN